jgi:hypothetical protein
VPRLLAATLVALLALAPAAAANDASVVSTYKSHKRGVERIVKRYVHAARRFNRTGSASDGRAVIRIDTRMSRALAKLAHAVAAEKPSSAAGRRAKSCSLREAKYWRRANHFEIASIRAFVSGHQARARKLIRRANRTQRHKTFPNTKCRRAAFAAIARGS